MSYHCGIGASMRRVGFQPREPHITCDGCGVVRAVIKPTGEPYAWFLNGYLDGKPAPKWSTKRNDDATRRDWCPRCKDGGR